MLPKDLYISCFPTGSNYICNPPVTNTDIDFMYYVYDIFEVTEWLKENGWQPCAKKEYDTDIWSAWRKGEYNLLFTPNKDYYDKFEAATELAKKRNLLEKKDRIALFGRICGKTWHNNNVQREFTPALGFAAPPPREPRWEVQAEQEVPMPEPGDVPIGTRTIRPLPTFRQLNINDNVLPEIDQATLKTLIRMPLRNTTV